MKGGSRDNSLRVPPGVRRDFIAPLSRGIKLKNDPPASAKPICQRRKLIERSISRGPRSVFAWQGNNRIASPNLVYNPRNTFLSADDERFDESFAVVSGLADAGRINFVRKTESTRVFTWSSIILFRATCRERVAAENPAKTGKRQKEKNGSRLGWSERYQLSGATNRPVAR